MLNIEDVFTQEWFWGAVAAICALAAIVGGMVSWAVSNIIKHRERPEADWAITMTPSAGTSDIWHGFVGIVVSGSIANAGDGSAFNLRIEGQNCTASFPDYSGARIPLLGPGDAATFYAKLPLDGWSSASMRLTWTVPPTRLKKSKSLTINPFEMSQAPEIEYRGNGGEMVTKQQWQELQLSR